MGYLIAGAAGFVVGFGLRWFVDRRRNKKLKIELLDSFYIDSITGEISVEDIEVYKRMERNEKDNKSR